MSENATLLTADSRPFTAGAAPYYDSPKPGDRTAEPRIYVRVEPAFFGMGVLAMVDTGAPWCIFEPSIGQAIQDRLEELPETRVLDTRLGRFEGRLYLGNVTVLAEQGEDLHIETTIFLCSDWPGGNFVGYQGFLDRFCLGLNPHRNIFYFGPGW